MHMKHFLIFTLLFICNLMLSQEENKNNPIDNKNEIKLDLFNLVALGKFSISYERILKNEISVGISILKTTQNHIENRLSINNKVLELQIIPYFRYNYNIKNNSRFLYLEVFSAYNTGKYYGTSRFSDGQYAYYDVENNRFSDVALGFSTGLKEYIFKNLIFDMNVGLGRNMFNNESHDVIPRVGLNIGYNF